MNFSANGKCYELDPELRSRVKAGWQEMLKPAKGRLGKVEPIQSYLPLMNKAEQFVDFIGKDILEVGCNEGMRSYLMARYEGTRVHGIDVDDYTVLQSPDMKIWNPEDIKFTTRMFYNVRDELSNKFPQSVSCKVTFSTESIENYATPNPHDLIISWDTLEHIIDLPLAFKQMFNSLKTGGISYHEYNPFFAINGGHSLCTLDFLYGHCRITGQDFRRYVSEYRPEEEEIDINFYTKCLNRASMADIRKYATDSGFEILFFEGTHTRGLENIRSHIKDDILPDVVNLYPTVTLEDLLCDSVQLVLRKNGRNTQGRAERLELASATA
jgi:SAM-dependent methyltransferase